MKLLIDVHGDDGALFAAWTIQRERPYVLVVFDSYIQSARGADGCGAAARRLEHLNAMEELGSERYGEIFAWTGRQQFLGYRDDTIQSSKYIAADIATRVVEMREEVTDIWVPAFEEGGHEQHNLVAFACNAFEGTCNVHRYLTYTRAGGKSRDLHYRCHLPGCVAIHLGPAVEVPPPSGEAIARKLRALACFKSQMQLDPRLGTAEWFYGNDLREYELLPAKRGEKP